MLSDVLLQPPQNPREKDSLPRNSLAIWPYRNLDAPSKMFWPHCVLYMLHSLGTLEECVIIAGSAASAWSSLINKEIGTFHRRSHANAQQGNC